MNDNELLDLLKKEPQSGLSAVVRQYSAYVMKIAYVKLGEVCTNEDIEEAVSDIFFKFYKMGTDCGFAMTSVRGILSVIAERHCIDIFRRQRSYDETID